MLDEISQEFIQQKTEKVKSQNAEEYFDSMAYYKKEINKQNIEDNNEILKENFSDNNLIIEARKKNIHFQKGNKII